MDEYGTAEIKHAHHRSAAGIKMQRQGNQSALVIAQPLGDGIVDGAQRVGFVIDLEPFGKPVVPDVIMIRNRSLPSIAISGSSADTEANACSYGVLPCALRLSMASSLLASMCSLARAHRSWVSVAAFENKGAWLKKFQHRGAFLGAPVVIERNRDGADLGNTK